MWGIVPAAGQASRLQPLAFSKELLPLARHHDGQSGSLRPVIDYIIERLIIGGATRICFVVSPKKSDLMTYLTGKTLPVDVCFVVQPEPLGLCDAIFKAIPVVNQPDTVMIGLPDTVWFPEDGFNFLNDDVASLLLFPVAQPQLFDVALLDNNRRVIEVQGKKTTPDSNWVWGAMKFPAGVFHDLFRLWVANGRAYSELCSLLNAFVAQGGTVNGVCAGESYFDVGTPAGYLDVLQLLYTDDPSLGGHSLASRLVRTA